MKTTLTTLAIATALAFPAAAGASLPVHPGHPILPVSAAEAKRERAMTKSFHLRPAYPAAPLKQEFRNWIRR